MPWERGHKSSRTQQSGIATHKGKSSRNQRFRELGDLAVSVSDAVGARVKKFAHTAERYCNAQAQKFPESMIPGAWRLGSFRFRCRGSAGKKVRAHSKAGARIACGGTPLVPPTGLEPVQYLYRGILSPLCLPIPPRRLIRFILAWAEEKIKSGLPDFSQKT